MEQFMKLMRDGRRMFTDEDDKVMMRLIQTTHAHDGQVVEVKPLLALVKEILNPTSSSPTATAEGALRGHVGRAMESLKKKTTTAAFEELADTIHKISREISCRCTGGGDNTHLTMSAMINTLSSYSWDAKVVLVLAAFALTYGEFLLGANKWSPPETLTNLIDAMVQVAEYVTDCIASFSKLPRQNTIDQSVFHISVYWTVRSVVACAPQFFGLIGLGHEYSLSRVEDEELYKLTKNLVVSFGQLKEQLHIISVYIAEMKLFEEYQMLVQLFEMTHTDNIEILKALIIETKHGLKQQLFQTSTKQRFGIDILRGKNVLLLISELNVFQEEIGMLFEIYRKFLDQQTRQESQIEVVCITMGDSTEAKRGDFELQLSKMPWYWVHHDKKDAVDKYIKEVWHFNKKPILVVLNPQGNIISYNAFPNIKIWGKPDLYITIKTEEELWSKASWGLEFLLGNISIYEYMNKWVNENRYICLYGGEDSDWIKKFTKTARIVAADAKIKFEMVYMGMRDQTERLQSTISVVTKEKLSLCLPEAEMSTFWTRMESMWQSKMHKKSYNKKDEMIKEIQTMLTFGGSEQGWAVICEGTTIKAKAKGDMILSCFEQYSSWKESARVNFMEAVNGYLIKSQENISRHCNRIILSGL